VNITTDAFGCLANTIKVAAGHYVDLSNPTPNMIDIDSIAIALGRICRFGGHCPRFYSVAEHSVHATELARKAGMKTDIMRAVLLHDAAEAYIGDVVKPLKIILPGYAEIERRIEKAIAERFNVDFERYYISIRTCDRLMLKAEKRSMWPNDSHEWHGFNEIPTADVDFQYYRPETAAEVFLNRCVSVGIEV